MWGGPLNNNQHLAVRNLTQNANGRRRGALQHPRRRRRKGRRAAFKSDFIVITEFCEHKGPVCRKIIGNHGNFDLKTYGTKTLAQGAPTDNMGVLVDLPNECAGVFFQHMQLYDIHARGYVRTMTFGYISRDTKKLARAMPHFLAGFKMIAEMLKKSNRSQFLKEAETKVKSIAQDEDELQLLHSLIDKLHKQREEALHNFLKVEATELITDPVLYETDNMSDTSSMPAASFEGEDELARMSNGLNKSNGLDDGYGVFEHRPRNASLLDFATVDSNRSSYSVDSDTEPGSTSSDDHEQNVPIDLQTNVTLNNKSLRTLKQLCSSWNEAMRQLEDIKKYFGRSSPLLQLEQQSLNFFIPTSLLFVMGNSGISNFYTNYNMPPRSWHALNSSANGNASNEAPVAQNVDAYVNNFFIHKRNKHYTDKFGGVWHSSRKRPSGIGILQLLKDGFHYLKHIIYSLLIGRPVIVIGKGVDGEPNPDVEAAVQALSIFVPGYHYRCKRWYKKDIVNWQVLSTIKLMGLDNSARIHEGIKRYITVFDMDTRVIYCPVYEGEGFINTLYDVNQTWPNEDIYLNNIKLQFEELALEAWKYYHIFCCIDVENDAEGVEERAQKEEIHFKTHGTLPCDVPIIKYMAFIVKEQQYLESRGQKKNSQQGFRLRLDYSECKMVSATTLSPSPKAAHKTGQ